MSTFRITIASPPDRERLVAEVFHGTEQIAELNREHEPLAVRLELYPRADGQPWSVDAEQFLTAIAEVKGKAR